MSVVLAWLASHKALLASLIYAGALVVAGQPAVALAVILAALSGGVHPIPSPVSRA